MIASAYLHKIFAYTKTMNIHYLAGLCHQLLLFWIQLIVCAVPMCMRACVHAYHINPAMKEKVSKLVC